MEVPPHVRIVEVGPRDGLQNEALPVPIGARVRLIQDLVDAGLCSVECGSFVSPSRVPQMAGTEAVFERLQRISGVTYRALVPNLKGLERALACRLEEVAVFVAASESFSKANLNSSMGESLQHSAEVVTAARAQGLRVRGYVSCVLGCPFERAVSVGAVASVSSRLAAMGCYEISLGDTIGVGTARDVERLLFAVRSEVPATQLAVHFHDTYGQALANILAALEMGISVVDSSVAGLGGCPYAPGATGNVATEEVVYMLEGMGIRTGVNLRRLAGAGREICAQLGRKTGSKVAAALAASDAAVQGEIRS